MITGLQQLLIMGAAGASLLTVAPRFRHRHLTTVATLGIVAFVVVGVASLSLTLGMRWDIVALAAAFSASVPTIAAVARRRDTAIHSFMLAVLSILSIGFVWACRLMITGQADTARITLFLTAALLPMGLALAWSRFNAALDALPGTVLGIASIGLISLPLLTGGYRNGAFINFSLPLLGTVQPGEVGRLLLILWLARSVAAQRAVLVTSTSLRDVATLVWRLTAPAIVGVAVGIISNDLGPALLLVVASLIIVFVGGLGWRYVALVIAVGIVGIGAVAKLSGKVARRFATLADPLGTELKAPLEQIGLGLVAMAHGPTGLAQGVERTVPEWNTDMLTASIVHEMGMGMVIAILVALIAAAVATWQLIRRLPNDQHQLRLVGIVAMVTTQAILMLAAVFSLAPLTGMPIPFLSFSGSSMVAAGLAGALVVSVWPELSGVQGSQTVRRRSGAWAASVVLLCLVLLAKAVLLVVGAEETVSSVRGRDPILNRLAITHAGDIVTADGTLIATTVAKEPTEALRLANARREYHFEMYRNLLGSASFPGLEHAVTQSQACHLGDCQPTVVTLQHRVQQVAWAGLAGRTGSVAAVDLQSGDIIAYAARVDGDESPQSDRIRSHAVAPGSVAKVLTGVAAAHFQVDLERPPASEFNGIRALDSTACGGDLSSAMAVSCNPYFAQLGQELGPDGIAWAEHWLNAQSTISGLPVSASRLITQEDGAPLTALGAIGLGDARVTPLSLLSVTAQIARSGSPVCMRLLADGDEECAGLPELDQTETDLVADAMLEVARSGTARNVPGIHDIDAAAKTGTADFDGALANATFIAFAPTAAPRYAVVAVIEPGPANTTGLIGSRDAGPVAIQVLTAALELDAKR